MDILQKSKLDERETYPYYLYTAYLYYILLAELVNEPNKEERDSAFEQIKALSGLQNYKGTRKVDISRMCVKLFGVKSGAKILDLYYRARMRKKGQPLQIRKADK
jgi:hypothetical protein